MPLANGAAVGEDGEIERELYDREQGEKRVVTAEEVDEGGVAFADEFEKQTQEDGSAEYVPKSEEVFAGIGDEVKQMAEDSVRYVMPDMTDMLADGTNIVPFINHNSGPRAIMGARQMAQGVSLKDAEAPLVDTVAGDGETFFERLGKRYNVTSKKPGTVKEINEDSIVVQADDGTEETHPLFNNLALNQGGFIDHTPDVSAGDTVEEGERMTTSNYSDDDGRLAIGKNLDVAYTPFNGFSYEDALVMSEKGAQKLTSEHVYEKVLELEDNDKVGLEIYESEMADRGSTKDIDRSKLGSNGVIREGETVEKGDLLVPAVSVGAERKNEKRTATLEKMFSKMNLDNRDRSLYWEKPFEGKVTKVENTPTVVRVFVKSTEPFKTVWIAAENIC
jgi:DNA-directed RNA polymerase subunit beta